MSFDILDNCNDCGACCLHMRSPPFCVLWRDGVPIREVGDGSLAGEDFDRLMAAPEEARRIMYAGLVSNRPDESPCSWLDPKTHTCRYHEFRPDICRDFMVGGESCLDARWRYGKPGGFVARREP